MPLNTSPRFQLWYNGTPAEKLSQARLLRQELGEQLLADAAFKAELEQLRHRCQALTNQMQAMAMGALCTACASRAGGGCCSALMADNTDSLQILINLLLKQPGLGQFFSRCAVVPELEAGRGEEGHGDSFRG